MPSTNHQLPSETPGEALVALGANVAAGDSPPAATLRAALDRLEGVGGVSVRAHSSAYRTPAMPAGAGPDFVNAAARLHVTLPPEALLDVLHDVEAAFGRPARGGGLRWRPRSCDLDLLAMGARVLPDRETVAQWMALDPEAARAATPDRLLLPHPRLHERAFVLVPLAEIAPDWRHPLLDATASALRDALDPAERAAARVLPAW